eukprot:TRINITY_DN11630_c0_g1_i1.p1 TRINITY_DN11630_c0_g1~~TRINITY_DN11630_c0_g1_i1.p1  ORF type:complete len:551 (+),score=94.03 TRINITY_DN11630_c0_g1_i1:31-1683(+)
MDSGAVVGFWERLGLHQLFSPNTNSAADVPVTASSNTSDTTKVVSNPTKRHEGIGQVCDNTNEKKMRSERQRARADRPRRPERAEARECPGSARRKKLARSNSARPDLISGGSKRGFPNSVPLPLTGILELTDEQLRKSKFRRILENSELIDLEELRKVSWNGIPTELRAEVWKLLLGYVPPLRTRHASTLSKKRSQYWDLANQTFEVITDEDSLPPYERKMYQQIAVDVPRIDSSIPLFTCAKIQKALFRLLYTWATRHAATGYVQGMSDLLVPFMSAFLEPHVGKALADLSVDDVDGLWPIFSDIEADLYWCLGNFLGTVQDNYTFAQPGIQKMLFQLSVIVRRIDESLAEHLKKHDIEYIQFAFKWTNCLLVREFTLPDIMRIWDTYFSEESSFASLHTYLCAAIIIHFKTEIKNLKETQDLMYYLQHLPLENWSLGDIESLISQAYVYKQQFHESPSHLNTSSPVQLHTSSSPDKKCASISSSNTKRERKKSREKLSGSAPCPRVEYPNAAARSSTSTNSPIAIKTDKRKKRIKEQASPAFFPNSV